MKKYDRIAIAATATVLCIMAIFLGWLAVHCAANSGVWMPGRIFGALAFGLLALVILGIAGDELAECLDTK